MRKPTAIINTAMRDAFLSADISNAPEALVSRVARVALRGVGVIKRFQMWNKVKI